MDEQNRIIEEMAQKKIAATEVSSNTHKNDRCRLLHLFNDPLFTTCWYGAHQQMTRAVLDDKEHRDDLWGRLADAQKSHQRTTRW